MSRKLATVETITSISSIPNADNIEACRIRGWDAVAKKGEFKPGDRCIYFEVDSLLNVNDPRFAFLAPRGVRTDATGRVGHVLKTVRLRGQYSQGLALPIEDFPEINPAVYDVTSALNIVVWDPPIPASLAGKAKGPRPNWIPKTDEERIQNAAEILDNYRNLDWIATEKIDGMSVSFYLDDGEFGVCSRNLDLLETEENTPWKVAREIDAEGVLRVFSKSAGTRVAIQGELYGEGIQSNPLKIRGHKFALFSIIVNGVERPREQWSWGFETMSVPVLDLPFPKILEAALAQAETLKSAINPSRPAEGVVWKVRDMAYISTTNVRASFKVISNRYLVRTGS